MPALNQGILAALALSTANKALHATQVIGLPFTGPLVLGPYEPHRERRGYERADQTWA